MFLSDPSTLLQRIPELETLATDARIRRAIGTGDPFKVYRALAWAKWLRRLPDHRETIKTLVRQRRLFAKPLNGMPIQFTVNSVGFGFVGKAEVEPDDSYIALHAFVALYRIPVIPLRSYLVQQASSSRHSGDLHLLARVPSSLLGWTYTRCLALAMMGLLVWSAAATITKSHTQDVLVVNGFDLPVDITLDGKQSTIPPLGHEKITVNTGEVQGRATAHGIVVDTLRQNIDSSGSTTIWNVAGAAPISQKTISYFKTAPETPPSAPEPIMYCGQHYIQIRHVDDTFTPPPRSVRMRRLQQQVDRIHLDLATATGSSGVSTCTDYLFEHDQEGKAAHFLEAQAELNGWDTGNTYMAMIAAALASDANANRIGERAIKARPDDLMLHRHYQLVSDYLGQETPLLQQYAEMARRQPGSASAQYLYAVLLHGPAGLATFKKLAATFGKDTNILKSLAWRRTAHGDYSGAAQAWSALYRISPDDAADVADAQVRALVALGRSKEAVALLTSMLQEGGTGNYAAELLMVLNLNGVDSRRVLENFDKDAKDNPDFDPIRVRGGIEPVGNASAHLPLVKLMLALRDDPAAALKTAPALTHADIVQLGSEQWGLLYCEAARVGDEALTMRMDLLTSGTVRAARDILKRFARGEKISLDGADLEPGLRAAAMLVRSRNASLSPEERAEWRQRAAQSDLLHSVVTTALTRWPA